MLTLTSNAVMLAGVLGGWEVVLILAMILILLGVKRLPEIAKGLGDGLFEFRKEIDSQAYDAGRSLGGIYGKPAAEALTPDNQTAELYDPAVFQRAKGNNRGREKSWLRRWRTFLRLLWHAVLHRLKAK
jgi:TatA/E family protein of Tat protein translocase